MRYLAEYNGKRIMVEIEQDEYPESPLYLWEDSAPVIACEHRRYLLGHDKGKELVKELVRESANYRETWEEEYFQKPTGGWYENKNYLNLDNWRDLTTAAEKVGCLVRLVYLYDHSGLAVSLSPFSCPWDSGIVGIMVWSKEQREKYHGKKFRDTAKRHAADMQVMESYFSEWAAYIEGDIYCITVTDAETGEHVDSCGGISGWKYAQEQALKDIFGVDPATLEEYDEEPLAA